MNRSITQAIEWDKLNGGNHRQRQLFIIMRESWINISFYDSNCLYRISFNLLSISSKKFLTSLTDMAVKLSY